MCPHARSPNIRIRSETYTVFIVVDGARATTFVQHLLLGLRIVMRLYNVWRNGWTPSTVPRRVFVLIRLVSPPKSKISSDVLAVNLPSTGPSPPRPNRAEAAVRVFKATLRDLCAQIGTLPKLKHVAVRELLIKTAAVRNSMVTYGGKNG